LDDVLGRLASQLWDWKAAGKLASANAPIYVSSAQHIREACILAADAQPLAVVSDYPGLVAALRQRVSDLGTTTVAIDSLAGLPDAYTAKLLTNAKTLGRVSFGPLLGALGLKIHLMSDEAALDRIRHRLPPRGTCGPRLVKPPDRTERRRRDKALARSLRQLARQQQKASAA
jgi:hypothetical protein